jgi:hypothetical protein
MRRLDEPGLVVLVGFALELSRFFTRLRRLPRISRPCSSGADVFRVGDTLQRIARPFSSRRLLHPPFHLPSVRNCGLHGHML